MSEIQATLNFHVQFGNFVNIDLFQRGFYQLRCSVETSIKASQLEFPNVLPISSLVPKSNSHSSNRQSQHGASGNATNNQPQIIFLSKPFLINYKKQEVKVNEGFEFRLHLLVDTDKIEESIDAASYTLNIELWSYNISPSDPINPEFKDEMLERMELCCTRSVRFHFISSTGLFHYIPVFFDYFHLSVVGLTVFGMLLAIHQPYLGFLRQSRNPNAMGKFAEQSTLEAIFFGSPQLAASIRLQRSLRIHSTICSLLLRSLDSLQRHFDELSSLLDPSQFQALDNTDRVNCADRLAKLTEILGQLQAEEDILQMANTQIAQLCAANVVLWSQFIAMARLHPEIELYLATIHAKLRRRRFLEAFLTASFPKKRLLTSSVEPRSNSHSARAAIIRQSEYLRSLPVLPLQQVDLDESSALHPIIFEDIYTLNVTEDEMAQQEKERLSALSVSSLSASNLDTKAIVSTPNKTKKNSSSSTESRNGVKAAASATELSRNSSSTSSLSTNGTVNTTVTSVNGEKGSRKLWSVKRRSKHTLRNEVADFGKKQNVTVVGVRWRRADDDFFLPSPSKSVSSSVVETPHFADSPPPSMPVMRTNKFVTSATKRMDEGEDDDDELRPSAVTAKQRRFKSMVEDPTDEELRLVRSHFRKSLREAQNSSPIFEPVLASAQEEPVAHKSQEPSEVSEQSEANRDQEMIHSLISTFRGRSLSCDASAMLSEEEANLIRMASIRKQVTLRRSTSSGCLPLSPLDESRASGQHLAPFSLGGVEVSSLSSISGIETKDKVAPENRNGSSSTEDQTTRLVLRLSESDGDRETDSVSSSLSRGRSGSITQHPIIEPAPTDSRPSSMFGGFWNEKLTLQEMLSDMAAIDEVQATGGTCLEASSYSTTTQNNLTASSASCISMQPCSSNGMERSDSNNLISQSAFAFSAKFTRAKEHVQRRIGTDYRGTFCSDRLLTADDFAATPAELPLAYFCTQVNGFSKGVSGHVDLDDLGSGFVGRPYNSTLTGKSVHLVVCVHGLEGNCCDLRLVRAYLELLLPDQRFKFLMSTSNQSDTFTDVDRMADNLVHEIQLAYNSTRSRIVRISFIGHSLGTLIIRAALAKPAMVRFRERFYTFLSLSGPHLGTLYSTSSLVNMGIWLIQKWKKSSSLLQLSMRDHPDVRQTFLYKLSEKEGLEFFKNVLFVGSHQDHYVPYHSARIELCRMAVKDSSTQGVAYREMVDNILRPLATSTSKVVNLARFDCYFSLPSGADNLIGRAAHVAVLDSDLFLEKFFTVIARKYFV